MTRTFGRPLALVVAAGALLRLVYGWQRRDVELWGDAYFYGESARVIAEGEGWINPLQFRNTGAVEQAADHPPLYLAYLAIWALLGVDTPWGQILVTLPIGIATVAVVGLAGRRVGGDRVGLIAAGLAAFYPNVWSWDGMVLSETSAILCVSVVLLLAYRYVDRPGTLAAAALGAAVGAAALARAELLALSALLVVPLVLRQRELPLRRRFTRLVAAGTACVVVLAPWVTFNLSRFEEPVLLSAGFEITLSSSTCADTYYGPFTGYWSINCPAQALAERGLNNENTTQPERSEVVADAALDYIAENKGRIPAVILARWGRISGLYRPIQQAQLDHFPEGRELPVTYAAMASWYALAGLAVVGTVALRRRDRPAFPLLAPLLVVWFAVTITFATNRYRASAETALCLLAAVGIDAAWRLWTRLRDDPDDAAPGPAAPTT